MQWENRQLWEALQRTLEWNGRLERERERPKGEIYWVRLPDAAGTAGD